MLLNSNHETTIRTIGRIIAPIEPVKAVTSMPTATITKPESMVTITAIERFTGSYSLFQS